MTYWNPSLFDKEFVYLSICILLVVSLSSCASSDKRFVHVGHVHGCDDPVLDVHAHAHDLGDARAHDHQVHSPSPSSKAK